MTEVELSKILIDESNPEQVIVLKDKNQDKYLPVVIGINEALSIRMKLSGFVPPRPLTHDLIVSMLSNLEVAVKKVLVDKFEEGTFFAKIVLQTKDGNTKIIDARPSDSVAIAVRTGAPIYVSEEILNKSDIA